MRMAIVLLTAFLVSVAHADELTRMIQEDLATLGYEPGEANGEATIPTVVAISKFQAEHDLEVTGEASPQLAGIIKAQISKGGRDNPAPETPATAESTSPSRTPEELQAAQQQCLMEHYAAARESQKKKRGFGSLISAVSRTASQLGNNSVSAEIAKASSDVYNANATVDDLSSAAKDLGLTEDQVEACRNPQ